MLKIFIERPVLLTVISVVIVILGVLAYMGLPVTQYPEIAPPTVVVSASYTGAGAEVIQRNVIVLLEEQINGVEGMTYMTSTATNDGSATITVFSGWALTRHRCSKCTEQGAAGKQRTAGRGDQGRCNG